MEGGGYVVTQRVDQNGKPYDNKEKRELKAMDVVVVEPFTAHAFMLEPKSTMINYSSSRFDPNSMDMIPITVVDPHSL